jgi:nitrate reductase gamma subunit
MVLGLIGVVLLGVEGLNLELLFGVVIPYLSVVIFFLGIIYRVIKWGTSPVPFHIPTTCGQQKTLSWIKHSRFESPFTKLEAIGRMILEVLLFRSLFRNIRVEVKKEGPKVVYWSNKWLWLGSILFHYSFLVVLLRHFRFFSDPPLSLVHLLEKVDGFLEIWVPGLYISGVVLLAAVTYLLIRRMFLPTLRYISLAADYFPLFLIIAIAGSGILMRYFFRIDVVNIKALAMGLVSFNPTVPEGISLLFYVHLFLVSVLFAYFPFSKLVHAPGIFLSPTRNLPNNSRAVRHINPWNPVVKVHTYEEYEEEFREKMKKAGIPVEKE